MEMKIIPANGGGPGMDGVFLSGYGDGDYTPPAPVNCHPYMQGNLALSARFLGRVRLLNFRLEKIEPILI